MTFKRLAFCVVAAVVLATFATIVHGQADPEPVPLFGTQPLPWPRPWDLFMYPVIAGLTGCMAIHYVMIVTVANKLLGDAWDGKVED